jgi:hypothetical protein
LGPVMPRQAAIVQSEPVASVIVGKFGKISLRFYPNTAMLLALAAASTSFTVL